MFGYELLIWIGAAIAMLGVVGLLATAFMAWKMRQSAMDDAAIRAALQKGVIRNFIALFVAVLGLMMVVIAIALR